MLARLRWLPMMMLEPDGKTNLSRLELPAAPGERYTLGDEVWFDPGTGRFKRILSRGGKAIFATVYDGKAIATYDPARPAGLVPKPVSAAFKIPQNPAEILGIGAGVPVAAEKLKESDWTAAGEEKLKENGAAGVTCKRYKAASPGEGAESGNDWIFKVRQDDQTLASMEWRLKGTPILEIRRVKLEKLRGQTVAWNLGGVPPAGPASQVAAGGQVGVVANMVQPGVSVAEMAAQASFATYLFAKNPAWTTRRTITAMIDPVSPGQRMFSLVYPAGDHRYVVLVHSPTYNRMLGPMVKMGKMIYQSPSGFKVWSGPRDAWLAGILLQSSQYVTKEQPAENRTGYLLESPEGTFPALAVNGALSERELHGLIDSLVPAKGFKE